MRYCKECVQPETRPGIFLDDQGICSACIGHREKIEKIDWEERKGELGKLLAKFRRKGGCYYDCIVGVSGGKDSTYQVHVLKNIFNMHPLCVTYKTPLRTDLGQANLDNMVRTLKVDLIELTVSPSTEKKFIYKAIEEVGDCAIPEHLGIFAFTLRMAINFRIPLVVWGENPQLEYGGTEEERKNPYLNRNWLMRHGLLQKRMAEDWIREDLSAEELVPFMIPSDEEFANAKICSTFLGHYLKWDPVENAKIAMDLGFKARVEGPVMGLYDFSDVDCKLITWHHYPKWLKFGMTRTFDNVAVEIRNGRMTRAEGIEWIRRNKDDMPPKDHLDSLCSFLGITQETLMHLLEKFRNTEIWKKDKDGNWYIPGFITEITC